MVKKKTKPRKRKCKAYHGDIRCNTEFVPKFPNQQWCSDECQEIKIKEALGKVRKAEERKAKREARELERVKKKEVKDHKESLKKISWFHARAQESFNAYIRYRDKDEECISCDKLLKWEDSYDAGHFKTRGSRPDLAYNEDNVHGQCQQCNRFQSANLTRYEEKLIQKIGFDRVQALKVEPKGSEKSYTRDELKEIRETYKVKLKELQDEL